MSTLTENLKRLRMMRGWTLAQTAIKLDVSSPAMSKIENGKTDITFSRLKQLAELYDVPVTILLNNEVSDPDYDSKMSVLKARLASREDEINSLQKKLIALHTQLLNLV